MKRDILGNNLFSSRMLLLDGRMESKFHKIWPKITREKFQNIFVSALQTFVLLKIRD